MRYFIVVFLLWSSVVHAGGYIVQIRNFNGGESCAGPAGPVQTYDDPATACNALTAGLQVSGSRCASPSGTYTLVSWDNAVCVWSCRNEGGNDCGYAERMVVACADGSAPVNGICSTAQCPMYGTAEGDAAAAANPPPGCVCPSGTKWSGAGCRKKCNSSNAGDVANAGWDMFIPDGQTEGCWGGCGIQHFAGPYEQAKGGKFARAAYTGWACEGNGEGTKATPDGKPQPESPKLDESKKHPPKCGAGEGVLTSSSGSVNCVPEGTPAASTPKVDSQKKTETFPDSSTKTTETTTTTDPNTNASSTSTSSTSSGGMAGPAGTSNSVSQSSSSGSGSGNGNGDGDGQCDKTLNFCGGPDTKNLYTKKDKTIQGPLTTFADGIKSSAMGTDAANFFKLSIPVAGCPNWSYDVPYFDMRVSLSDVICSSAALAMMDLAGAILLLTAAFRSFKWAIL